MTCRQLKEVLSAGPPPSPALLVADLFRLPFTDSLGARTPPGRLRSTTKDHLFSA